ncbi:hypothetical protein KJV04_003808 [Salmonella enterica]|nr:hypothetical protein [Salmonella enterica]
MKKSIALILASVFFAGSAMASDVDKLATKKEPHLYECSSFFWNNGEIEKPYPGYVTVADDLSTFTIHNIKTGEKAKSGKLELSGKVREYSSGTEARMKNENAYLLYRSIRGSMFRIGKLGDSATSKSAMSCVLINN